jgi:hypothetical protein
MFDRDSYHTENIAAKKKVGFSEIYMTDQWDTVSSIGDGSYKQIDQLKLQMKQCVMCDKKWLTFELALLCEKKCRQSAVVTEPVYSVSSSEEPETPRRGRAHTAPTCILQQLDSDEKADGGPTIRGHRMQKCGSGNDTIKKKRQYSNKREMPRPTNDVQTIPQWLIQHIQDIGKEDVERYSSHLFNFGFDSVSSIKKEGIANDFNFMKQIHKRIIVRQLKDWNQ